MKLFQALVGAILFGDVGAQMQTVVYKLHHVHILDLRHLLFRFRMIIKVKVIQNLLNNIHVIPGTDWG